MRLAEWIDYGLGLLMVGLVVVGGRVTLHLLRPHPKASSSPWIGENRKTLFLLLVAGQGSLLLACLSLFMGREIVSLDFILYRIMQFVCPLMLVNASLLYIRGGDSQKPGSCKATCVKPNTSSVLSRKETLREIVKRHSHGCVESLMPFLWSYLWTVAVAVFVGDLLNWKMYPTVPRSSFSFTSVVNSQQRGNQPSATTVPEINPFSPPERFASAMLFVQNSLSTDSPLTEQRPIDCYRYVCVSVYSELMLYCAFYLPLLLYVAFHVWLLRQRTVQITVHDRMSIHPFTTCLPSDPVHQQGFTRSPASQAHHSCQGSARPVPLFLTTPSSNTVNTFQNEQCPPPTNRARILNEEQHSQTCEKGDNLVLPEGIVGSDLYRKPHDSQTLPKEDWLTPSISDTISTASQNLKGDAGSRDLQPAQTKDGREDCRLGMPVPKMSETETISARAPSQNLKVDKGSLDHLQSVQVAADSEEMRDADERGGCAQAALETNSASQDVKVDAESLDRVQFAHAAAGAEEMADGRENCRACAQVAPYVPLATLVVLVQHVVLSPLWVAAVGYWRPPSQQQQLLQVLPSCTLFLPVYCALCFTFWAT